MFYSSHIPGLPLECHVMSQNSGPPAKSLSKRDNKLPAPAGVRGGKNSSEKKLSPLSIRDVILVARLIGPKCTGEVERGVLSKLQLRELRELPGEDGTPLDVELFERHFSIVECRIFVRKSGALWTLSISDAMLRLSIRLIKNNARREHVDVYSIIIIIIMSILNIDIYVLN